MKKVMLEVLPLLHELGRCKFPSGAIGISRGAISIAVQSDRLPIAEEIYEMIAKKAESLFGIKDVVVTFSDGRGGGPLSRVGPQGPLSPAQTQPDFSLPASSGWEPPWNEPFCPIPGGVKVTAGDYEWCTTTASFAVQRPIPWWPDDEDYIVSGHKGPDITPVNMRIYQPTVPHEAGRIADNVERRTYADAARVGISDARVRPYILIGGTESNPVLRPVVASDDPAIEDLIWISAGRTGFTFSGTVVKYHDFLNLPPEWPYERLYNQILITPTFYWPIDGDSGSPVWDPPAGGQAKIHGLLAGWEIVNGQEFIVVSPVSGVKREFPGWRVWLR